MTSVPIHNHEDEMGDEFRNVKASELRIGDMVDLEHGEFFQSGDPDHPSLVKYEYGVVGDVIHESPDCVVIEFENIGTGGYDPDHVFEVWRPTTPNPF